MIAFHHFLSTLFHQSIFKPSPVLTQRSSLTIGQWERPVALILCLFFFYTHFSSSFSILTKCLATDELRQQTQFNLYNYLNIVFKCLKNYKS